jgi:HK97 gp10 family phage protein
MTMTIKVEGLSKLDQRLGELSFEDAEDLLWDIGRNALEPFEAAWVPRAPRQTGRLQRSARIGRVSAMERRAVERKSFVEIFAGPSRATFYGQFSEFGTYKEPAHPFLRPAWDSTQETVLQKVQTGLAAALDAKTGR